MTITLAFYKGNAKVKHKAIALFTRGSYSHVVYVIHRYSYMMDCVASSRAHYGTRRVLLEYHESDWDILEVDVDEKDIDVFLEDKLGTDYHYNALWLSVLFRLPLDGCNKYTCSSLLAEAVGFRCPSLYTPNSLYKKLLRYNRYNKYSGIWRLIAYVKTLI